MANETLSWVLGFCNSSGNYLTAEQFGGKINAAGTSMKRRQIFTLEQNPGANTVYLKAFTGKYLSADKDGKVNALGESRGKDQGFNVVVQPDGRWVLQGAYGYYFGGTGDNVHAFNRDVSETEKWFVQLAIHPQVAVRNINRKAYVHLEGGELRCNELIPWGSDAMVIIEFQVGGKYSIQAADGKFLQKDGALVATFGPDSLYIIEFFESKIAFRANDGKYLQGYGSTGQLRTRNNVISKDELFELEDSHPQGTFKASNGRYVSVRQTSEAKADQQVAEDGETYQLEFVGGGKWAVRSFKGLYWTVAANGSVVVEGKSREEGASFEVSWYGPKVSLKTAGRFVCITSGGQLKGNGDKEDDSAKFIFTLVNRPSLILRCEHGFVDHKKAEARLTCNNVDGDVFAVTSVDGVYQIKGENGKWLVTHPDFTVSASGHQAESWSIELLAHSRVGLRSQNGNYLVGENSGKILAKGKTFSEDALWEF